MEDFQRVVQEFMVEFGTSLKVIVISGDNVEYDPSTSSATVAEVEYFYKGMVFDFTLQSNGMQAQAGTQIQVGDKQVFLQPSTALPKPRPERDFVVLDGKRWKIVTLKEVNPTLQAADSALYELLVRA